ncbi:MAG: ABC transporter ATP-binding protein [Alphaproteobacteria bacterium]
MTRIIEFQNISKIYNEQAETPLTILDNISFALEQGEVSALIGPSGAGKSTMLHIAGLLEQPSKGEVFIDGQNASKLNDIKRSYLRGHYLGFVYQFHHLLPEFTSLENAAMPLLIQNTSKKEAYGKAQGLLERVGLAHRITHKPSQLSGGEKQRVAIARALVNEPKLLLADEPTGNLDPTTAQDVFSLFMEIAKENKLTAIIATHNHDLAYQMPKRLVMKDQKIIIEQGC